MLDLKLGRIWRSKMDWKDFEKVLERNKREVTYVEAIGLGG